MYTCLFRSLYQKLGSIIPSCKNKPVSNVDIVLRAVDYINDLHKMLREEEEDQDAPPPLMKLHNNEVKKEETNGS